MSYLPMVLWDQSIIHEQIQETFPVDHPFRSAVMNLMGIPGLDIREMCHDAGHMVYFKYCCYGEAAFVAVMDLYQELFKWTQEERVLHPENLSLLIDHGQTKTKGLYRSSIAIAYANDHRVIDANPLPETEVVLAVNHITAYVVKRFARRRA